jgi:hypothetical protein
MGVYIARYVVKRFGEPLALFEKWESAKAYARGRYRIEVVPLCGGFCE